MVGLRHGLGSVPTEFTGPNLRTYSRDAYEEGGRATFSAACFLLFSLGAAKCSVVIFVQRLLARDSKRLHLACYVLCGIFVIWSLASVIGLGVNCDTSSYILDDAAHKCGNQASRCSSAHGCCGCAFADDV
jgi:hypothetical protein